MKTAICAAGTLVFGVLVGAVLFRGASSAEARRPQQAAPTLADLPRAASTDHHFSSAISPANYLTEESAPPKRLADDDAVPVAGEEAVRAVIERTLRDATPEERQIWFDELKGLPPAIVEDLLALRRQIGSAQPKATGGLIPHADPQPQHHAPSPIADAWSETILTLTQVRDIHRHNLANLHSPGYRRLIPETAPLAPPNENARSRGARWGSQWLGARLDLEPGEIVATGRSLDVAIEGDGWLAVRTADGVRYTRCGRLMLDDQRRLSVSTARGPLPLDPRVELPPAARQVRLREDGAVFAALGETDALVKCGQIQLAHVQEPALLSYQSDGLLQAAPEASAITMATPGQADVGTLAPMSLERSNVDAEEESRAIQRINRWLEEAKGER